jgi:hypothetical protein
MRRGGSVDPYLKYSHIKVLSDSELLKMTEEEQIFIETSQVKPDQECYNACLAEIKRRGLKR